MVAVMSEAPWTVASDTVRAEFSLDGGRMTSLRFGDVEVMKTADPREDVWWGALIMAPWAGVVPGAAIEFDGETHGLTATWGDDALHGLVRHERFEREEDGLAASLSEGPWRGRMHVRAMPGDHLIDVELSLRADQRMPAVVGWHPWFARSLRGVPAGRVELAPTARMRQEGEWRMPTSPPWDDVFTHALPARVRWQGVGTLTVTASGPCVGVYDPEPEGFAIEPLTGTPGVPAMVVEAGETLSLRVRLSWEPA